MKYLSDVSVKIGGEEVSGITSIKWNHNKNSNPIGKIVSCDIMKDGTISVGYKSNPKWVEDEYSEKDVIKRKRLDTKKRLEHDIEANREMYGKVVRNPLTTEMIKDAYQSLYNPCKEIVIKGTDKFIAKRTGVGCYKIEPKVPQVGR
jgi:hypothetical protein